MRGVLLSLMVMGLCATAAYSATTKPPEPKPVTTQKIVPPSALEQTAGEEQPETDKRPDISFDVDALPAPVKAMRQKIIDAAKTGDIEKLLPVIQANEFPPSFPSSEGEGDGPLDALKHVSGDDAGREILAIMIELLETGYAHVDKGGSQDMYVWPYLAELPLSKLTPEQEVDLYQLITPGDRADMAVYDQYVFFRIGIGPDGVWHYFLTGE